MHLDIPNPSGFAASPSAPPACASGVTKDGNRMEVFLAAKIIYVCIYIYICYVFIYFFIYLSIYYLFTYLFLYLYEGFSGRSSLTTREHFPYQIQGHSWGFPPVPLSYGEVKWGCYNLRKLPKSVYHDSHIITKNNSFRFSKPIHWDLVISQSKLYRVSHKKSFELPLWLPFVG